MQKTKGELVEEFYEELNKFDKITDYIDTLDVQIAQSEMELCELKWKRRTATEMALTKKVLGCESCDVYQTRLAEISTKFESAYDIAVELDFQTTECKKTCPFGYYCAE